MKTTKSKGATASSLIKAELTKAFPSIKFSVRYSCFSGGDSVDISWKFGPTCAQVEAISDKYQAGSFDGMTDSYTYHKAKDYPTVKYVQAQRDTLNDETKEFKKLIGLDLCKKFGIEYEGENTCIGGEWLSQYTHRIFYKTSFKTSAPTFKGLVLINSEWRVLFTEVIKGQTVKPHFTAFTVKEYCRQYA